jgi:FKBP-type peptidyl-prolyl cis-trans isomerase SlyD
MPSPPFFYKFDYAIRNPEGDVVDSSAGGESMSFIDGDGTMIAGLEKALNGRSVGDEFQVTIQPEDAYGWPQRSLIRVLGSEMFDVDRASVEVGMIFQVGSGDTREVVKVIEINENDVTVDGNHPLAGITFHFDIHVLEARPATPEEVAFSRLQPGDQPVQ